MHVLANLVFACGVCTARAGTAADLADFEERFIAVDIFTVELWGLPRSATATEVKEYLTTQVNYNTSSTSATTFDSNRAPHLHTRTTT